MADPVTMGLMLGGGLLQAGGNIMAGNASMAAAEQQAAQLRLNAGQQRAAGQRSAVERVREADILKSKMLAIAGASGGGTADPTMINLFGEATARGKLAADTEMYNAESSAIGMESQASAALTTGRAQQTASRMKAIGSLLSTASTAYKNG